MTVRKKPVRIEGDMAYVPLTKGYEAIIDAEDAKLIGAENWCVTGPGVQIGGGCIYAMRRAKCDGVMTTIKMHRLIINAPDGFQIDHIDGNGLNNRKENLRVVTPAQNLKNRRLSRHNTSGFKGVSWSKSRQKWMANIFSDGRAYHLGEYDSPEEAHKAYVEGSKRYHGDYGRAG